MFITNINVIFPILIMHMIDVKITFFISVIHITDVKKIIHVNLDIQTLFQTKKNDILLM